jgi:hypothetical protein
MDKVDWNRLARKRERLRVHGTDNPFCCACGEHHWAVRYELHHIARRKYDPLTMRLCLSCHDKVSDMQKDHPPVPSGTDPNVAMLTQMLRGRMDLACLMLEFDGRILALLTGHLPLPSPQTEGADDGQL